MRCLPLLLLAMPLTLAACGPVAARELRSSTPIEASVDQNDEFLQGLAVVIKLHLDAAPELTLGGATMRCAGETTLQDTLAWTCDADRRAQIVYAILDDQLTAHIFTVDDAQGHDLKALSDAWVEQAKARWAAAHP